ncbi:MAG: DUF935 family protein, partial [Cyanobacteria bacterium P01_H01_bin.15]
PWISPSDKYKDAVIINQVHVKPASRESQDIQKWRNAMKTAESTSQQRKKLFDLYKDILLDGFLSSCVDKRIVSITNRNLSFSIDEEQVDEVVALTEKTFFEEFLKNVLESKFYGHSLVELNWPGPGREGGGWTKLVDRAHVKPRFGIVTQHAHELDGYRFREEPFIRYCIEAGDDESLGKLLEAAQYVIYKRGNFGDWAEFAEVFGMPFRWATYSNEQSREILVKALEEAGSAGFVVAPEDAKLDFKTPANGQGNDIFRYLREACNEEIAITILGNSMTTTEAKSSGYAQSKVQAIGQDELHRADRKFVLRILNEKLTPYLERLGYKVAGGKWSFIEEETMSLSERLKIDIKLNGIVPIPESYWYGKYKVPRPTADDPPARSFQKEDDDPKKKVKLRSLKLKELYCGDCLNLNDGDFNNRFVKIPKATERAFLKRFLQDQWGRSYVDDIMYREYYGRLRQFAEAGWGRKLTKPGDWKEFELLEGFKRNLSHFAAAKVQTLSDQLRPFLQLSLAQYMKEGEKVMRYFNRNYLNAELQTVLASANSASKWADIVKRSHIYPNLEYRTAGDERVRPGHAAMNGLIYPVNHPFWDTHMPPNGYLCRCVVTQTDKPAREGQDIPAPDAGFRNNPGKTGLAFTDDHSYFDAQLRQKVGEQAERYRALFEASEVAGLAQQFYGRKFALPGLERPAMLTKDGAEAIMKGGHPDPALKNDLLSVVLMAASQLRFAKQDESGWTYVLELLGTSFYFQFTEAEGKVVLSAIKDKI